MQARRRQSECRQPATMVGVLAVGVGLIVACLGCHAPNSGLNGSCLRDEFNQRLAETPSLNTIPGQVELPPTVYLDDGLSEDEAVAIALWNNRDFLSTLANLGIARGDLVQAGLLTNPQLNFLFPPIGTKQLEWTLYTPIEAFLLRNRRIEIAERDFQRVCNELVQNGLNVARDARLAYADYRFAIDRYELAKEAVDVRVDINDLAERRLAAGDISELEATVTRIDANRTRAEAEGLQLAVNIAEANLKNVIGIATLDEPLHLPEATPPSVPPLDEEMLIQEALAIRPDMKAAWIAVQAAERRVELARRSFWRIDAVADGNSGGAGPTNTGPGMRFEIPIFNRNQGLIIRSQWTVDQARHNYESVHDRVITEVRSSIAQVQQASKNLDLLRELVLPDLEDAIEYSRMSYRDGGAGYFLVLQSTSQLIDSRIRELELSANLRRSLAELDRSVGRRLSSPVIESSSIQPLDRTNADQFPAMPALENDARLSVPDASQSTRRVAWANTDDREFTEAATSLPIGLLQPNGSFTPKRFILSPMHAD